MINNYSTTNINNRSHGDPEDEGGSVMTLEDVQ